MRSSWMFVICFAMLILYTNGRILRPETSWEDELEDDLANNKRSLACSCEDGSGRTGTHWIFDCPKGWADCGGFRCCVETSK
uniref:N.vectensis toxin 4 n=2 Tax=Nematostella vectensis TaxID=45351 RepID=NV4_NEMVE|nr:RecName: Full=N.vectensis toxin 4; Short=Nv4; Flags: Precursor [Nematostella vectensis]QEV81587.1 Nv4 toxin precursor [Nematostella vectensis]